MPSDREAVNFTCYYNNLPFVILLVISRFDAFIIRRANGTCTIEKEDIPGLVTARNEARPAARTHASKAGRRAGGRAGGRERGKEGVKSGSSKLDIGL